MQRKLSEYQALVFDCDGVLLDSNRVKTDSFYEAALPYGAGPAQAIKDYHQSRGGISRYKKFEYFFTDILQTVPAAGEMEKVLQDYANYVHQGLMECPITPQLEELREYSRQSKWLVISGGDQQELREVFAARNLSRLFEGGIFGSPDSKDEILARLIASSELTLPSLFVGDSRYDHQASTRVGLDFVFADGWTEFPDWKNYTQTHEIQIITRVADLIGR